MQMDDNTIITLAPELLFSRETMLSILDEEPEEQERLRALLTARAKELGLQAEMKKALRAYIDADKQLADEFKKANARKNATINLDFDGQGRPLSTIENFIKVLKNDAKFSGLCFNMLTYSPEQIRNGKAEKWTDADDAETRRYIEKKYKFHSVQKCDDALRIIFAENQYHPIRDRIESIKWDGVSRIYDFLHKWTKCDDTPYTREVSRLIFAGGINRLYNPGCKFDDMPVLIGTKQGEGKSTLVRWLALSDTFFTEVNEFEGQKGIEAIEGAWICEVSELLALTKVKEQEAVKSFLTRLNDRYRMPFDKRTTDHQRQCIFIGTTNKEQFLTDKTGNRRFYPVIVHQSGYELFDAEKECRDYICQCWAEAKALYDKGKLKPYADKSLMKEIKIAQDEAVEDDYRVGMIEDFLSTHTETCILQLWKEALQNEFTKPTKKDSNDIALILQSLGWKRDEKTLRRGCYGVQRWWRRENEDFEEIITDDDDESMLDDF